MSTPSDVPRPSAEILFQPQTIEVLFRLLDETRLTLERLLNAVSHADENRFLEGLRFRNIALLPGDKVSAFTTIPSSGVGIEDGLSTDRILRRTEALDELFSRTQKQFLSRLGELDEEGQGELIDNIGATRERLRLEAPPTFTFDDVKDFLEKNEVSRNSISRTINCLQIQWHDVPNIEFSDLASRFNTLLNSSDFGEGVARNVLNFLSYRGVDTERLELEFLLKFKPKSQSTPELLARFNRRMR